MTAMGEKQPETPLPRGRDTALLGLLTSVGGTSVGGFEQPSSIERLFMRLRIFWFFFMAIPIVIGAYVIGALAAGLVVLILGGGSAATETPFLAVGIGGFIVGAVLFVRLFAALFTRLTRGYRARLEARAGVEAAAAPKPRPAPSPQSDHMSLAELDARLAPRSNTVDEDV